MKVLITGSKNPLSVAHMWYAERMGEVFEVENDPKFDEYFKTVNPIFKEHQGHIKKVDCKVIKD